MSTRHPKQWPPAYAPRTTTSPDVQEVLDILAEAVELPEPPGPRTGPSTATIRTLLEEVRRLQEHESRLRQDLEGTFHLVRLLYSSRDAARKKLEALEGGTTPADDRSEERG